MNERKYTGQVVLWDANRAFGFIETTEELPFGEHKIFVHHSNCIDVLSLGAYCEFEVAAAYKIGRKPQAVRVTVRKNVAGLAVLSQAVTE